MSSIRAIRYKSEMNGEEIVATCKRYFPTGVRWTINVSNVFLGSDKKYVDLSKSEAKMLLKVLKL